MTEALVSEWRQLAESPQENLANPRCAEIASQLAARGLAGLQPLIDVLADPNADPHAKVLVVTSIQHLMQPALVPVLAELTKPTFDGTTRACATQLLAFGGSEADAALKALISDPEERVRMAALVALITRGDAEARAELVNMYQLPDTTVVQRERILLVVFDDPQPGDVPILAEAAGDGELDETTRTLAIATLGEVGDLSVVETLSQVGEADEDFRGLADQAIASIRERTVSPDDTAPE